MKDIKNLSWFNNKSRLLIMFMLVLSVLPLANVKLSADEEISRTNAYAYASGLSGYYSTASNTDDTVCERGIWATAKCSEVLEANNDITFSDAGSLAGYTDPDLDGETFAFLSGMFGRAGQSRSFGAFPYADELVTDGDTMTSHQAIDEYTQFGSGLDDLGVDVAVTGDFTDGLYWLGRMFMGGLVLIAYTFANLSSNVFDAAISILQALNPFQWFVDGVANTTGQNISSAVNSSTDMPVILQSVVDGLTSFYSMIYNLSLFIIIPFSIILVFLGMVFLDHDGPVGNARANLGRFKTIILTFVFIVVGIPTLGFIYTAMLNGLADNGKDTTRMIDSVVYSSFIDVDTWATDYHYALPSGVSMTVNSEGNVTSFEDSEGGKSLQQLALDINGMLGYETGSLDDYNTVSKDDARSMSGLKSANKIISAYMSADLVTSSDIEAEFKDAFDTTITETDDTDEDDGTLSNPDDVGYCIIETIEDSKGIVSSQGVPDGDPKVKGCNANDNGIGYVDNAQYTNMANDGGKSISTSMTDKQKTTFTGSNKGTKFNYDDSDGNNRKNNALSTLSTYNFVATDFGHNGKYVVYTPREVSSLGHRSVTSVGNNVGKLVYMIHAAVALASVGIFAFIIGFQMIFKQIMRTMKLLVTIGAAMLSSFTALIRVIIMVAVMMLEIIVGYMLFQVGSAFILGVNDIFVMPLMTSITSSFGVGFSPASAGVLNVLGVALSTAIIVMSTGVFAKAYFGVMIIIEEFLDKLMELLSGNSMARAGIGSGDQASAYDSTTNAMKAGGTNAMKAGKSGINGVKAGAKGSMSAGKAAKAGIMGKAGTDAGSSTNNGAFNPGGSGTSHKEKDGPKEGEEATKMGVDKDGNAVPLGEDGSVPEGVTPLKDDNGDVDSHNGLGYLATNNDGVVPTDDNGNISDAYTNKDGSAIYDSNGHGDLERDENGDPLKDNNGNAIYDNDGNGDVLRDQEGQPMMGSDGAPIYDTDENGGKTVGGQAVDSDGNPITPDPEIPKDATPEQEKSIRDGVAAMTAAGVAMNAKGEPLRSKNEAGGNLVKDENGNPMLDKNGDGIYDKSTDGSSSVLAKSGGKPVMGKDGKPMYKYTDNGNKTLKKDKNGKLRYQKSNATDKAKYEASKNTKQNMDKFKNSKVVKGTRKGTEGIKNTKANVHNKTISRNSSINNTSNPSRNDTKRNNVDTSNKVDNSNKPNRSNKRNNNNRSNKRNRLN